MTQKHYYQSYAVASQTVAKTKQIVMLYDGVIRFLQQAKEALVENRIEDRYKALIKATDIILGMQKCLDFENGGDMAKILFGFYSSIYSRIYSIHRSRSIATCDEVIAEVKKMRDVWNEIDQKAVANAIAPDTAASEAPGKTGSTTGSEQDRTLSA